MINLKKVKLTYTIFALSSCHHVDIIILVFLVVMILLFLFYLVIYHTSTKIAKVYPVTTRVYD
jgi:hypothetical protein